MDSIFADKDTYESLSDKTNCVCVDHSIDYAKLIMQETDESKRKELGIARSYKIHGLRGKHKPVTTMVRMGAFIIPELAFEKVD